MKVLANGIEAAQDGLEGELPIDKDLVRPLRRWSMGFYALERCDSFVAAEYPSRCPKWRVMMGILSVQHNRPAIAEVKFDHFLCSLTTNLEPDSVPQAVRTHIRCKVLEKAGADAGKAIDSALDIFVRDKAILLDKHKDVTTHFGKVNFF